jgi:hypothetical protein
LRLAVFVGEIASEDNPGADKLEVVRGDDAHVDLLGHAVLAGQCEGEREDAGEALKFVLGRFAQVNEICVGKGEVLDTATAHVSGENDELVGIFVRERAQEDSVGDAEDGSAGADAEGDGQGGSEREDGTLAKSSACECQIA